MSLSTEALFTAALGLQAPWRVERAELNTSVLKYSFQPAPSRCAGALTALRAKLRSM